MNDQIREYTQDIVYVMVTKEFYDEAQELKKADKRTTHFDEPLEVDQFNITDADTILAYRVKILQLIGFKPELGGSFYKDSMDRRYNGNALKTISDNKFFESIEELKPHVNLG